MTAIRVVLADDQRMFREAIATLLSRHDDIEVVEAGTGREALAAAELHQPDVIVLDIEMPDGDGLTIAARLRERAPDLRCLIVTTFGRPGYLQRALDNHVAGFVVKDAPADTIAEAIRRAAAGQRIIDPELAVLARHRGANPLTPGERQVLDATTTGASIAQIAATLHLAPGTVRNRISTAITKLNARNRTDAARIAEENGWL